MKHGAIDVSPQSDGRVSSDWSRAVSVLTKIFVVSLVVLSLLLSAATITFVNSVDDYQNTIAQQKLQLATLEGQRNEMKSANDAQAAEQQTALAAANKALGDATSTINSLNAQVGTIGATAAAAESRASVAEGNVNKLTAAVQASSAIQTQLQQQVATLRDENDKLQTQNGDANVALADFTNKYNVADAERRNLSEQLQEIKGQFDKVSGALRDLGHDPSRITSSGLAAGAPPLNGLVRATQVINGIPHAQISIGSDDAVKVGMEFSVLDRSSGKFLGKLTIVAVEPNAAIGRLVGPDITAIAAGAEVRTQL